MRIILTANYSPWSAYSGGGQRSTHSLAEALAARGHDVAVVFTKPPWERVPVPDELPYRLHWAPLLALRSRRAAVLRPLVPVLLLRTLRRILRPGEAAVVHANGDEGALLHRLRPRFRVALVSTPRFSSVPAGFEAGAGPLKQLQVTLAHPKHRLQRQAAQAADAWVPTSHYAAQLFRDGYGLPEPAAIIPNGVSTAWHAFRRPPRTRGPVVFFGRFSRDKGADVLLDALYRLKSDAPPAVLVGRGDAREALQRQATNAGLDVEIRPWSSPQALGTLLETAGAVALPSRAESFGLAVAEALCVACPTVSTTVGGIPEILTPGVHGWLVPPDDADALAEALRQIYGNPAEADARAAAGAEWVRTQLTWDRAAASFEALYRRQLDRL